MSKLKHSDWLPPKSQTNQITQARARNPKMFITWDLVFPSFLSTSFTPFVFILHSFCSHSSLLFVLDHPLIYPNTSLFCPQPSLLFVLNLPTFLSSPFPPFCHHPSHLHDFSSFFKLFPSTQCVSSWNVLSYKAPNSPYCIGKPNQPLDHNLRVHETYLYNTVLKMCIHMPW